jgi:hypothetical protein
MPSKHREFDYVIETRTILPFEKISTDLKEYEYAAKVTRLVRLVPGSPAHDVGPVRAGLHEHWGATEQEAHDKAAAEVDAWIEEQEQLPDDN